MQQQAVQYLIILFSLALFAIALIIISLINYFLKKKAEYILDKERSAAEYDLSLAHAKEEIIEQNLKNISWELHDNVGQLLSVASIELNVIRSKMDPPSLELTEVSELISKSLSEIRRMSKTLNTEMVHKQGLTEALRVELSRLSRLELLKSNLDVDEEINFTKEQEIIIFRMLQEFTVNVLKHAEATILTIEIKNRVDKIFIKATDNGKGYDKDKVSSSNGLLHLKRRAELMGATYKYNSVLGKGTTMEIEIYKGVINNGET